MFEMRNLLEDLKAIYIEPKHYQVRSAGENNPWTIDIYQNVSYNNSEWIWKVDSQLFSCDEYACNYLTALIQEKTTGVRIIYQNHQDIPAICGDGSYCRAENNNWKFSMLCSDCPKAHKHQVDHDGLIIEYRDERFEARKDFVAKCAKVLRIAKPHLVFCDYRLGKEIPGNDFKQYPPEDEYVVITCENGYRYTIPIEGNSLCAIAAAIFNSMAHK